MVNAAVVEQLLLGDNGGSGDGSDGGGGGGEGGSSGSQSEKALLGSLQLSSVGKYRFSKNWMELRPTHGPTDRRTDRPTGRSSYRVTRATARQHRNVKI